MRIKQKSRDYGCLGNNLMGYSSGKIAQNFFLIQSFSIDLVAYIKRYRSAETTICDKIGTYAEGYSVFFFVICGSEYQIMI